MWLLIHAGIWLLIHAGIKVDPCLWEGPLLIDKICLCGYQTYSNNTVMHKLVIAVNSKYENYVFVTAGLWFIFISLLRPLTAIVSQNLWWLTNHRHYIRLYLKLPIPRFNDIIPCASGRYKWSNMNFNNSAARRVPPWSWPKSYKFKVRWLGSDLWLSNSQQRWLAKHLCSRVCVTSWYVSFSRASYENACRPEWIVLVNSIRLKWHSERGRPLWFLESEITKYCHISQRNNHASAFRQSCLLHGVLIPTYIMNTLMFI